MIWTYEQSTGRMLLDGKLIAQGYSGRERGKNNPGYEWEECVGPCPKGKYTFGEPRDTAQHGPFFIPLIPDPENQMYGRSAFGCHGDSIAHPGQASEGCIIMPRFAREKMWYDGIHELEVVEG